MKKVAVKLSKEMDQEEASRYYETLKDLTINSRPHIVNLTELARDSKIPEIIVDIISTRIKNSQTPVSAKLPCLYLVDSIIKNHKDPYIPLFAKHLDTIFTHVFQKMDENGRKSLYKLRSTWTPWFHNKLLHNLDTMVNRIDPAWPICKLNLKKPNIHVNPAVFGNTTPEVSNSNDDELKKMEQELRELKKKEMQIKIEAAKKEIAEATRNLGASSEINILPNSSPAKDHSPGLQQQEKVCSFNFMVKVS